MKQDNQTNALGNSGHSRDLTSDIADASGTLSALGARIRMFRKERNLSLAKLSKASGVSVAMLSHIELSKATPSLKVLLKLRSALDLSMMDLFSTSDAASGDNDRQVLRLKNRNSLHFEEIGLTKQGLSPNDKSDLEVLLLVIKPGGGSGPDPWIRVGEKAGLVLSGRASLEISGDMYKLEAGDSFQFDSSKPHRLACVGDEEAKIVWIVKSSRLSKAVDA